MKFKLSPKILAGCFALVLGGSALCFGQESGNRVYQGQGTPRVPGDVSFGNLSGVETGNPETVQFLESYILMNVKPDAYIAVFGLAQEGATPTQSNGKLDSQIDAFIGEIKKLGVKEDDIFVDLTTQNRIYEFVPQAGGKAQEVFKGFETKKTIAVRYKNRDMLEKLSNAANKSSIFDLIKVDYIVNDLPSVRERLFSQAARIIKQKEARNAAALGIQLIPSTVFQEKFRAYYPAELYLSYQAFETGAVDYETRAISQRKSRTFYYEPLRTDNFDAVINPMGVEPMVQCTLYLRVKYDLKSNQTAPPGEVKTNSSFRTQMATIQGGTFLMGSDGGQEASRPAHTVAVKSFMMDKTEVTNAEYAEFVSETKHRAPENWDNGKPAKNELNLPVTGVSLEDARAFPAWRSKRDGVIYRLPTEDEWEYAARNGGDATAYPWGNEFGEKRAAVGTTLLVTVGSMPDGANKWGVVDLIGNVWEWTDSPIVPYSGSEAEVRVKAGSPDYIIRGGSIRSEKHKVDATFRQWVDASRRDRLLGFRLVRDVK